MDGLETFLDQYGPVALLGVMLAKAAGVPIPVPGDLVLLLAATRAATGKLGLAEAFLSLLLALVLGGVVQFWLARGPGRLFLYRYGRYLGLTRARLDRAAVALRHGGVPTVALAILTPGIRAASVAACGIAAVPARTFLPGLALGSAAFLGLHFTIGYVGGNEPGNAR